MNFNEIKTNLSKAVYISVEIVLGLGHACYILGSENPT